ncbi:acyl-CoA dehydrogenase family protein [Rhodococcus opacus]|uniref:Acyl-CoA dehydrogenase family protein n=1 Tax=Rhodococcus opacus TaxID=37919 RepID=A0ABT4NP71_RHOOP|nr:acyl-CoA dehydrogenase family protein [Rhodococcus opacus]MCZ4589176.1 acyl-CoA dehydrogenase family protein [Rhodococcus opacus]
MKVDDEQLLASDEGLERMALAFLGDRPRRSSRTGPLVWGEGDDAAVAIWDDPDPDIERTDLDIAREYRRARFDAGLGWLDGPVEHGGAGLNAASQRRFAALEAQFETPSQTFFKLDRVLSPILLRYADPKVAQQRIRGLFRGDKIACELFSEPGAGSDLASLRTKAVQDGDTWIINGQKVWTSDAHYADIGLALCRTESDVPDRKGLTAFLVDMHGPGVEVRPLRQITGGSSFNEVFLTDVRVPDAHRIANGGQGWEVAQETLKIERTAIGVGLGRGGAGVANGERLVALVRALGLESEPVVRQQLAEVYAAFRAAKHLQNTTVVRQRANDTSTASPMLAKLALSNNLRLASRFVTDVLGPRLAANTGEWGTFAWNQFVLGEPGMHIMAGTDEVVHNMIGEQVLGLPREPRPQP